jgi:hypothetical protein
MTFPFLYLFFQVALGWNELMSILFSPTYLILFSFIGMLLTIIYYLNLFGPLEGFVRLIASEFLGLGREKVTTWIEDKGYPKVAERVAKVLGDEPKKLKTN